MTEYTGVDNLEVMRLALNYNRHLCEIVRRHDPGTGPAVDFGAGLGTFSGCALSGRERVLCIEPDNDLRAHLQATGYRAADATREIPENSVAYIFSLNVLEHIADDAAVLRDLTRCMQPGGRLVLYLPAFKVLYSSMDQKVGLTFRTSLDAFGRNFPSACRAQRSRGASAWMSRSVSFSQARSSFLTLR